MKEFEKWDNSLNPMDRRYQSIERKKGWRAALETLKEECYCAGMYGEKGSCELVDWINKELEEK